MVATARAKVCAEVDVSKIVNAKINSEIARMLSENHRDLIEQVVMEALKEEGDYGRTTKFQKEMQKMIRASAQDVFQRWLNKEQKKIERHILKLLKTDEEGFAAKVAGKLVESFADNFHVNVKLDYEG